MICLFLGAGFSKWAVGLPLARELFDFQIQPFGSREEAKLRLVITLKQDWDSQNPNAEPEKFIADAALFHTKHRQVVLWYITRRLSDPFIWTEFQSHRWRRHVLMIDENRKNEIPGVVAARNFLGRFIFELSGIMTTNYDLLIEYSLGTKGFNYGILHQHLFGRGAYPVSQWRNAVRLKGTIPVAKLHGSISWDETSYYADGRRGLTGNALIVAPAFEKSPPSKLEFHWDLSASLLKKSAHLAVFGFGFNTYDEAILSHLRRNGHEMKSVILIDIAPNITAARSLWPSADIKAVLPPPDGERALNQWIKSRRN